MTPTLCIHGLSQSEPPRQFAGGGTCAGKTKITNSRNAFHAAWHTAQKNRLTVAKPEAPAFNAIDNLLRAKPSLEDECNGGFFGDESSFSLWCEKIVTAVDGLVVDARHVAERLVARLNEEIRAGKWLALMCGAKVTRSPSKKAFYNL